MVDKPIPYRPEDPKLPHIDFEVAESDYDFPQKWNHKEKHESKPHQHGAESGKKEHLNKHQRILKKNNKSIKTKPGTLLSKNIIQNINIIRNTIKAKKEIRQKGNRINKDKE